MKKFGANILVSMINQILTLFVGIVVQRVILLDFGQNVDGISSLLSQIFAYAALLESGLGTASIQALYKPLSKYNWNDASSIMTATHRQYTKIAYIFTAILISIGILLGRFYSSELDWLFVLALTIAAGFSYFITYKFCGTYQVLLTADCRVYVFRIIDTITVALAAFLKIFFIFGINPNLEIGVYAVVVINLITVLMNLIKAVAMYAYVRVNYKQINWREKPNYAATNKRWNVLVHQLVGMVTNHTDVVLLATFSTLANVSIYNVYNYIYAHLSSIFTVVFCQAPQGTLGKLFQNKSDSKFNRLFNYYEWITITIAFCLLTIALVLTIPFVKLYVGRELSAQYADSIIAGMFFLSTLLNLVRIPAIVIVNISGDFKETQKGGILEAIINLSISIPMFFIWGIKGLLLGTICALAFRSIDIIVYVYRRVLHKKLKDFVPMLVTNLMISSILVFISYVISVPINSWKGFMVRGLVTSLSVFIIFMIGNSLIFLRDSRELFSYVKGIIREQR